MKDWRLKFKSGNSVEVRDAQLTRKDYLEIESEIENLTKRLNDACFEHSCEMGKEIQSGKNKDVYISELKDKLSFFLAPDTQTNQFKADAIEEMLNKSHHKQGVNRDWIEAYIAQLRGKPQWSDGVNNHDCDDIAKP